VVDVGTGSGAVALALKHERRDLAVTGVDSSADAVAVARENAARAGLEARFERADLLEGIDQDFDAVLANLPYVPAGTRLAPEIACYEPTGALFAGGDGLDVIRRLVGMLDGVSVVALEVGSGQAAVVSELLRAGGFTAMERLRDLAGHERVVVGRR
jgi:release factor glutamine methyltransferase